MAELQIPSHRLKLREFTPGDVRAIHHIATRKGFVFYNLDRSEATAETFVRNAIKLQAGDPVAGMRTHFKMAVECLKHPGRCIGYAAFDDLHKREAGVPDIGYLIDPAYQGKGYATEAMGALMAFCYTHVKGLDASWLTVHPDNLASQKVAAKLSFEKAGAKLIETRHGTEPRLIYKTGRDRFMRMRAAA